MRSSAGRGGLVLALLCATLPLPAAQVIVVLKTGGAGWQVVEAEKVSFNQKEKLRLGSGQAPEFRPDQYKKFTPMEILRAGVLRRHAGGYLVRRTDHGWEPVAADGAQVKTATSFAALWSSTSVAIQTELKSKTSKALQPGEIYAIIPGADRNQAVADLIADPGNFSGLGEASEDAAFEERMALLIALAPSVTGQGAAKLQQILLSEMLGADQRLGTGIAKAPDLTHGLRYVAVSAKAYPNDAQQKKARAALTDKKAWLDQRMAILKAFRAGELWDAYLNKYSDFERWDSSFSDLHKAREDAFQKSGQQHLAEGQRYYKDKSYSQVLRELKLAQAGLPSSQEIAALIEKVKFDEEHESAAARKPKVPEDTTSTNYRLVSRHLQTADSYINDKKLTEAENEILQAEATDKASPRILLSRAKLLQVQKQLLKALEILDEYARQVVDDGGKGDELRNKIAYELKSTRESMKKSVATAEAAGDYVKASKDAEDGLALDENDLDFLLHAGLNGAILRKNTEAAARLQKYLILSQTPGADQTQRANVYKAQAALKVTLPEPEGQPNWFSGYKSPGIAYCPLSLMPNARVADIKAKKLTSVFQWNGDQLAAVRTTSPDPADKDKEITVYFDYFKDRGGVRRVGTEPFEDTKKDLAPPQFTAKGVVGAGTGVYLGLPNHPVVDPLMIERLTGKRVATIVSGNPYFHPFAWMGMYVFLAEYDDYGRVKSAQQIPAAGQAARTLDFRWDGWKLMEISERGSDYKRTMTYAGNNLTLETITFRGKVSKIEYKYKGQQLFEANCGDDPSLDGRPRHVTFR